MPPVTLYRFKIDIADVDRGVYESIDIRVAQHPSETLHFLLTRTLAYALNVQDDLAFAPEGLANPDDPAMSISDPMGGMKLVIEIGNPSARRLHKDAKASKVVKVYTHKSAAPLIKEIQDNNVHRAREIEVYSLDDEFLDALAAILQRENKWNLVHDGGTLSINTENDSLNGELKRHRIN